MHRPPDHWTAERNASQRRASIDVRVRLIVALAAIGAVVLSTRPVLPLAVLGVALAALIAERRSWRALVGQFAAPLGLAAVVGLARMLTTGRTPLVTWDFGALHLVATREGADDGLRVGLHVLASVAAMLAACRNTPAADVFSALRWMRAPRVWLEIALLMHRYIYVFREQAESVMAAQRVRLGYAGWRTSVRSLGSLAGVVVLRCLVQTQRTYDAMQVRAYRGTWPLVAPPALGRRDQLGIAVAVGLLVAAYLLLERRVP
jgi:cobalt/nickel transport system permease protein